MDRANTKRAQAEAKFVQAKKKADTGGAAMLEYETNAESQRLKTQRLRALRLARDAEAKIPDGQDGGLVARGRR